MEFKAVDLFRIIYLIFFGIGMTFVLAVIEPALITVNLTSFLLLGDYIVAIFQLLINVIATFLTLIPSLLGLPPLPPDFPRVLQELLTYSFPASSVFEGEINLLNKIGELVARLGGTLIIILFPLAFFSGLGFIRDGDTRLSIGSFIAQQLILGIALFLPEATRVPFVLDFTDIFTLIASPMFLVGFVLYLYLEVSFQCAYALKVLQPMIDRENRVRSHLRRVNTFIPKSEVETEAVTQSGRRASGGLDVLSRSYVREMIERKVFRGQRKQEDFKVTLRLQGYLSRIASSYPDYEDTLSARTAQTRSFKIIEYSIPGIVIRMGVLLILAFVLLTPSYLLTISGIGDAVPPIMDSIELYQPEFRTVGLIIFVLGFILLGVISYITIAPKLEVEPEVQRFTRLVDFKDITEIEEELATESET